MSNCNNKTDFSGGSCCTPPGSNELSIKCAQVKAEIEKLAKTTEAQFLIQNQKIAETCIYIKENLSNAIRELLNDMQVSGDLDQIITDTVLDQIAALEDEIYPIGNVKRYGAVGDGTTDDTCALQAAAAAARENDMPLVAESRNL